MQRIVLKVGSHVLSEQNELCDERILNLVKLISNLMQKYEVILVSSGAIAAGFSKLNLDKTKLNNRQVLAALGQPYLMEKYSSDFAKFGIKTAQILLTASDFDSRKRTNYAKDLVDSLLKLKILPIINENDATALEEIIFGDNDSLSAYVTHYFDANLLVILSDIDGYYDSDPRKNNNAKMFKIVHEIDKNELEAPMEAGSNLGTGGIVTKLKAADFLIKHNKSMFLADGFELEYAKDYLFNSKFKKGTLFTPKERL